MGAPVQLHIQANVEPARKRLRRRSAALFAICQVVINRLVKGPLQLLHRPAFKVNIIVGIGQMTVKELISIIKGKC